MPEVLQMTMLKYLPEFDRAYQQYKPEVFCETGCQVGRGVGKAFAVGFKRVFSCDIRLPAVRKVRRKYPKAMVFHMKSTDFLHRFCEIVEEPTLFWLDAHYPWRYAKTPREEVSPEVDFPLLEEIKVLSEHKKGFERDVILCDDVSHIIDDNNPHWEKWKHTLKLDRECSSLFCWDILVRLITKTHNVRVVETMETSPVLVATPK